MNNSFDSNRTNVLGIIPAKGCSTRLPRKNILLLAGKPLLAWTVDAALGSDIMDRVIVSTEDSEVAEVARHLGVETIDRPKELAKDPAGVVDVSLHILDVVEQQGEFYNTVIIMLPTCPFRSAEDIKCAYELFCEREASVLMSVSPFQHTPLAALKVNNCGFLEPFNPQYSGIKSQELPLAYRPNGALHILDVETFRRERSYFAQPLLPYMMPLERSVDIDDAFDLKLAELMLQEQMCNG